MSYLRASMWMLNRGGGSGGERVHFELETVGLFRDLFFHAAELFFFLFFLFLRV